MTYRAALRTTRIIHAAITASIGIYGLILVNLGAQHGAVTPPRLAPAALFGILGAIGAVILVAVVPFVRSALMPRGAGGPLDLSQTVSREDPQLQRYRTANILSWALCESVAIMGLVAAILYGRGLYYVPYGAVALVALLVLAPRRDTFARALG